MTQEQKEVNDELERIGNMPIQNFHKVSLDESVGRYMDEVIEAAKDILEKPKQIKDLIKEVESFKSILMSIGFDSFMTDNSKGTDFRREYIFTLPIYSHVEDLLCIKISFKYKEVKTEIYFNSRCSESVQIKSIVEVKLSKYNLGDIIPQLEDVIKGCSQLNNLIDDILTLKRFEKESYGMAFFYHITILIRQYRNRSGFQLAYGFNFNDLLPLIKHKENVLLYLEGYGGIKWASNPSFNLALHSIYTSKLFY